MRFAAFDVGRSGPLTTSITSNEPKPEKADDTRKENPKANVGQDPKRLGVRSRLPRSARIQYFHAGSNFQVFETPEINVW
jgi:hypothetical protein